MDFGRIYFVRFLFYFFKKCWCYRLTLIPELKGKKTKRTAEMVTVGRRKKLRERERGRKGEALVT